METGIRMGVGTGTGEDGVRIGMGIGMGTGMPFWAHVELPLASVTLPHFELISFKIRKFYFQPGLAGSGTDQGMTHHRLLLLACYQISQICDVSVFCLLAVPQKRAQNEALPIVFSAGQVLTSSFINSDRVWLWGEQVGSGS